MGQRSKAQKEKTFRTTQKNARGALEEYRASEQKVRALAIAVMVQDVLLKKRAVEDEEKNNQLALLAEEEEELNNAIAQIEH